MQLFYPVRKHCHFQPVDLSYKLILLGKRSAYGNFLTGFISETGGEAVHAEYYERIPGSP
jgi:hypothetical protein